jgi:antitoxin VapB
MTTKTAKLFINGGSQAVRLPAEFRFEGADEVCIRRDAVTGDVILSPRSGKYVWADFFELRDRVRRQVPVGPGMVERFLNDTLQPAVPRKRS